MVRSGLTLGVDGCRGGWIAAFFQNGRFEGFEIFESFQKLWNTNAKASLILVDIPIGVKDGGDERRCDILARSLLGSRASSVFRVPCRRAIYADNYRKALVLNRKLTGYGFSKQTWNIVPRIKEVDLLLRSDEAARKIIKETHPEVCFRILSNSQIRFSKRKPEGIQERMRILRRFVRIGSVLESFSESFGRKADPSDILDALVVGLVSSMAEENLSTIPEKPEYDCYGLPMQMVVPRCHAKRWLS